MGHRFQFLYSLLIPAGFVYFVAWGAIAAKGEPMAAIEDYGFWVWNLSAEFWAVVFLAGYGLALIGAAYGWHVDKWSARIVRWVGLSIIIGALATLVVAAVTVGTIGPHVYGLALLCIVYAGLLVGDLKWWNRTR